ncbi:CPBP family intramembrane glutamic endopeptidase [Stenotrophomonas sp. 24(2023)]|uniref:CPBP family intramembrane glutamic endopeptidase n=1 Tax=Stenotrophomonas sp. 24(2023) TaxID=3068324 RepID=UPI0027E0A6B8|nr:CPBP family intramembrane glutamic endopeptidase [Stenotrophomonas sp. 24(2023)]WMJ70227.1 CPBP family intramembrane glutamic endopeptidase [Stenotrophomonas sp. 24(2023)]
MHARSRFPAWLLAAVALSGVALGLYVRDLSAAAGLPIPALPMPYGGSLLDNALAVLVAVVLVAALRPHRLATATALGLDRHGLRGPLWVLLASTAAWVGLAALGRFNTTLTLLDALMLAVLFPVAEELLFRGLGFVFLVRVLRWPWWLAALPQALLFGAVHAQGVGGLDGGAVALQVFALIALGGFVFAWLDHLDGDTLWCGLVLHVSMNLAWNVFSVPDAQALAWPATCLRLGVVALAVLLLSVGLRRHRRPL